MGRKHIRCVLKSSEFHVKIKVLFKRSSPKLQFIDIKQTWISKNKYISMVLSLFFSSQKDPQLYIEI